MIKSVMKSFAKGFGVLLALGVPLSALDLQDLINGSTSLGNDWYYSDWLGYYQTLDDPSLAEGHIYHNEHGTWYVTDDEDIGYWAVIESSMSVPDTVLILNANYYPVSIDRWVNGDWECTLSYTVGSAPYRKFYNHELSVEEGGWYAEQLYTPDGPNGPVPLWWKDLGLVDLSVGSDNKAPVLVGQLKHIASKVKKYLDCRFWAEGIEDTDWDAAYSSYGVSSNPLSSLAPASDDSDFAPATIGQLKFIASGIYTILDMYAPDYNINTRMTELGVNPVELRSSAPYFPWPEASGADNNAIANLGQLKLLFSFDELTMLGAPCPPPDIDVENDEPSTSELPPEPPMTLQETIFWVMSAGPPPSNPVQTFDNTSADTERTWLSFFEAKVPVGNPYAAGFDWFESHWFGWFAAKHNPNDPNAPPSGWKNLLIDGGLGGWLWHPHHQWLWASSLNVDNQLYLYDRRYFGWIYVNKELSIGKYNIKWLYSYKKDRWYYYLVRDDNASYPGRWFSYQDASDTFTQWIYVTDGADTDEDGLADAWESAHSYLGDTDGETDSDFDGLSNIAEQLQGGNPANFDNDGDLYSDEIENLAGSNSGAFTGVSALSGWPATPSPVPSGADLVLIAPTGGIYSVNLTNLVITKAN